MPVDYRLVWCLMCMEVPVDNRLVWCLRYMEDGGACR